MIKRHNGVVGAAFLLIVALNLLWTVVAFRGGSLPLLGFTSPGGPVAGLFWFIVVYPLSSLAFTAVVARLVTGWERRLGGSSDELAEDEAVKAVVLPLPSADRHRRTTDAVDNVEAALSEAVDGNGRAREQGLVDPLTGLLSRDGLVVALSGLRRGYAVALVELDRLSQVTGRLGHLAAERALCDVVDVLGSGRSGDLVARWSDSELVMVLPATDVSGAAARVERLLADAFSTVRVGGRPVSLSAGIADADDPSGFLAAVADADAAMYGTGPRVVIAIA